MNTDFYVDDALNWVPVVPEVACLGLHKTVSNKKKFSKLSPVEDELKGIIKEPDL